MKKQTFLQCRARARKSKVFRRQYIELREKMPWWSFRRDMCAIARVVIVFGALDLMERECPGITKRLFGGLR
jgi:hypothetical protein